MASAKRNAKIELVASTAGMDRGLGDARRKMRTFQRETTAASRAAAREEAKRQKDAEKARAQSVRSSSGFAKHVVAGIGAVAGFDLAGGIGGMFSDVADTEKELTRFGIDAQLSQQQLAEFRGEIMKVSEATGQSRNSLVRASHTYQILTGDAAGAASSVRLFADVANASGASMEDLAATGAALHNMKIDPKNMRQAFDILLYQGHQGAIEIRDLAGQMSSLQPMFGAFAGGNSVHGLAELGAAAQVMRKGFGGAEEMATGFRGAMSQLMSPAVAKKLEAAGAHIYKVDPVTKKKMLKDWLEVVGEIKKSKVGNDPIGLRGIFTNIRAFRAIEMAVQNYDEMARLANEAANSNQVSKDAQTYMASASGKIALAWEHAKNAIAGALTPERIDAFVAGITKAADAFSDIVQFASKTLGFFEHVGESVRGALGGNDARTYSNEDLNTVRTGGFVMGAKDNSEGTMAARVDAARRRMAGVDLANETAKNIMGAEADEKTTPESIRRAVFAKYSNVSDSQGGYYARDIGDKYLRAAGVSEDQAQQIFRDAFIAANKPLLDQLKNIATVIRGGTETTVAVQGNPIVKAHSNAIAQGTRPGGRR